MEQLKYPIGIQTFSKLREGNYIYIDKTEYLYKLVQGSPYVFLSRPRRFGKSLLMSTLESFFKGERQYFKDLAIDKLMPEQWESYPVLHFDLSGATYSSAEVVEKRLQLIMNFFEEKFNLAHTSGSATDRFITIVHSITRITGKKVVILIDEYDNPITSAIGNIELQNQFRDILYGFYSCLKMLDSEIRFCMLTGITKYGHLSVFSGLNNLNDISLLPEYGGICGITEEELRHTLHQGVGMLAKREGFTIEETYIELKNYYDGYHFSQSLLDVYNPFSLLNSLSNGHLSDYWFQSGVPTLLMKSLKSSAIDFSKISGSHASESLLNNISADRVEPLALLYQTGYLTIINYNRRHRIYTLDYPNKEITDGLMNSVLRVYGNTDNSELLVYNYQQLLRNGDIKEFVAELTRFFAKVPYDLRKNVEKFENYYHSLFYVIVKLLGMDIKAEYHTSEGSIDILIETDRYIYIIELKMHGNARGAIQQIEERDYAAQFKGDSRQIFKVGLGFSSATHTIDSFIII